jgi:hypothetical protein
MINTDDIEQRVTNKSRILRLQILLEEIKTKKRISYNDAVRFGMNRWWLSKRVIETYVQDLIMAKKIRIIQEAEGEYLECLEE